MYSFLEIKNQMFSDFYLLFCGIQECTPLYSFGPAVRSHHLLHYCVSGKGYYYAGDKQYTIEPGDAFLILPDEVTFYQADEQDPWTYLWVGFSENQVNDYLQRCGLDSEHLICHCEEKELLVSYIEDILRHNTLSYSNEIYIQGILFLIFASFSRSADIKYKSDFTSENIHISKAIEFIQKNYQNVITVRDIADYVSLNRSYLCSMFQENLHMSPQQFLLRFRVTKATELLSDTDLPVKNISYSCGYANQLAFSKAFKKITGLSPTAYRKENRNVPNIIRAFDPHKAENQKHSE